MKTYIGQTCYNLKQRLSKHIRSKSPIRRAVDKCNVSNFDIKATSGFSFERVN